MISKINITTQKECQLKDITREVNDCIAQSGVKDGVAFLHTVHTTAALTINENCDSDVQRDILYKLDQVFPRNDNHYTHCEGNSNAHIKSSLVGCDLNILIEDGRPVLGTWQGIYFCEFDGPRTRTVLVKVVEG